MSREPVLYGMGFDPEYECEKCGHEKTYLVLSDHNNVDYIKCPDCGSVRR